MRYMPYMMPYICENVVIYDKDINEICETYMGVNKKIDKFEDVEDTLRYIAGGAHVKSDMEIKIEKPDWKTICLRIPNHIFEAVDQKVKERAALTRTAWILEAIQQKLKAESKTDD